MKNWPLRWIALISILATILIGFALFAVYIDRVETNNRIAEVDAELVRASRSGGPPPPPRDAAAPTQAQAPAPADQTEVAEDIGSPVQLVVDQDRVAVGQSGVGNPFTDVEIQLLLDKSGFVTVETANYRVLVQDQDGDRTSITALSLESIDMAVSDFRTALVGGAAVLSALVAIVVWFLAAALTRPVTRIANTASRIAGGDLDTEIAVRGSSREISDLSRDLDVMLDTLRSAIQDAHQSAATAERSRDDMQRFLADMAHELRTPLTALRGYSELYAGGMLESSEDVDRAMSRIGSESERLHKMANEMLQLARQEPSDQQPEPVDIAAIAADVVDDLRAANPEQTIVLDIADLGHRQLMGVAAPLHQALLNVAANACNHSKPGDPVNITLKSDDANVVLRVIDNGPGIASQDRERVFLPFYRGDGSRSRTDHDGAGLGLALTKKIIERHDGTVAVEETPGGGATFVLSLPLSDSLVA